MASCEYVPPEAAVKKDDPDKTVDHLDLIGSFIKEKSEKIAK
jgi:hypothetical protein